MTNFAKYTLLGFVLVLTQPGLSYKLTGIKEDVNSDVAMEKILLNPRLRPSLKKPDHPVPTYFHKRTKDGEFVDRLGKDYGAEISLPRTEDLFVGQTGATINVNPLDDVPNGGAVEVSWKGVLQASNKDWLGYYCPKNDSSGHYLDYMLASKVAPETWMKGYGSFSVRLYNMRVDCEFRYYRSNNKTVLMGRSASVKFRNGPEAPLQARISMTRNPTEMRIMWSSGYGKMFFLASWIAQFAKSRIIHNEQLHRQTYIFRPSQMLLFLVYRFFLGSHSKINEQVGVLYRQEAFILRREGFSFFHLSFAEASLFPTHR